MAAPRAGRQGTSAPTPARPWPPPGPRPASPRYRRLPRCPERPRRSGPWSAAPEFPRPAARTSNRLCSRFIPPSHSMPPEPPLSDGNLHKNSNGILWDFIRDIPGKTLTERAIYSMIFGENPETPPAARKREEGCSMMANYGLPQQALSPRDSGQGQVFSIGVVFPKTGGSVLVRDRDSEKPLFFYSPERT